MTDRDRIVGYIDRLGYLRCVSCHEGDAEPVTRHGLDHPREKCDSCGRPVLDVYGDHRGYLILRIGEDHYHGVNRRTMLRVTTGVDADQIRRSIDHFLDRSCKNHRRCE